MFTYSLSTIKNSKNAGTFDAFLCKVHKYACEKLKIHKNMQLCANICKIKRRESRIKEASAKAISASADAFSYLVMSGTAARDFFNVLT